MNIILDTHAWLWFVLDDPQLSANARQHIIAPHTTKFVSPASYWEMAIKISSGKYALRVPFLQFVQQAIFGNGFRVFHISHRHADRVSVLPYPAAGHRDPFDRLIVSQALVDGMSVVSGDAALDFYGIARIW